MSLLSPASGVSASALGALAVNKASKGISSFVDLLRGGGTDVAGLDAASAVSLGTGNHQTANGGAALPKDVQALLDQFKRTMQQRFATAGIDYSQPVHLEEDSLGDITSDISHPDHEKIEQLFEDDPTLSAMFRQVRASITACPAGAAVESDSGQPFGLTLVGDQVTIDFAA